MSITKLSPRCASHRRDYLRSVHHTAESICDRFKAKSSKLRKNIRGVMDTTLRCDGYYTAVWWIPHCGVMDTTLRCDGYHTAVWWIPHCGVMDTTLWCDGYHTAVCNKHTEEMISARKQGRNLHLSLVTFQRTIRRNPLWLNISAKSKLNSKIL